MELDLQCQKHLSEFSARNRLRDFAVRETEKFPSVFRIMLPKTSSLLFFNFFFVYRNKRILLLESMEVFSQWNIIIIITIDL